MDTVENWICEHFGLTREDDRFQHVLVAIEYHARQADCADLGEFLHCLGQDPILYASLIEHLSVQESYFFRVPDQFSFIRDLILPQFVSRYGPFATFKAWSAGCASGEEVYSLAMLLHEAGLLDCARLLATDVSESALEKALRGLYRPWSFRGEERWPVMRRYFSVVTDGCQAVDPRLRRRIRFVQHNLLRSAYPDPANAICNLDLVLCRNVLIYFNRASAHQVVQRLQACLAPGGWLITGPSDPLVPAAQGCETVVTKAGVLYRRKIAGEADSNAAVWSDKNARQVAAQVPGPKPARSHSGWSDVTAQSDFPGRSSAGTPAEDQMAPRLLDKQSSVFDVAQAGSQGTAKGPEDPSAYFDDGLQAVVAGRLDDAVAAFRKALYLDDSLIIVQLNMAAVLERQGRHEDARRACQNAYRLAASQPADALVALVKDMTAGEIMVIARKQIARLTQRRY